MLLRKLVFVLLFLLCISLNNNAQKKQLASTQKQALKYLGDSADNLQQSIYWIHVHPQQLLKNVRNNIIKPLIVYGGNGTNFCGYAAVSYPLIQRYPLEYAKFMLQLYKKGSGYFHNNHFTPTDTIQHSAGLLRFKGEMDINPADQMWFLTLAGHFKGYINFFNRRYDFGDEEKLWASTNFAKFNRMLKKMMLVEVYKKGSDLIRPHVKNLPQFIAEKLPNHQMFLYLNNTILHKKNHNKIKKRIPTHFVVLLSIEQENDMITFVYWDYGFKTLQKIPLKTFKKIVYGISWYKKTNNPT